MKTTVIPCDPKIRYNQQKMPLSIWKNCGVAKTPPVNFSFNLQRPAGYWSPRRSEFKKLQKKL